MLQTFLPLEGVPSPSDGQSDLGGLPITCKYLLKKPLFPYPLILQMHHRGFQDHFKVWGAVIQNNRPQSHPHPGPRTCGCVSSRGRGDFAGGIKLRPLRRG